MPLPPVSYHTTATNTDVDEFQERCQRLTEEIANMKKEQHLQREEFRHELEKVDEENERWKTEMKTMQQQLILVEKKNHAKDEEIQRQIAAFNEQKSINESLAAKIDKLEENGRLLVKAVNRADGKTLELQKELEEKQLLMEKLKEQISEVQSINRNQMKRIETLEKDGDYWKEKYNEQLEKAEQFKEENQDLKDEVQALDTRLKEKIVQEEKYIRERQLNNHFKDFVQIKRTLQLTQQENEQLKLEIKKLQLRLVHLTTE